MAKMKQMDKRLRKAILSLDLKYGGDRYLPDELKVAAINLLHTLNVRELVNGFEGQKLNYDICKSIANLSIELERARLVWSPDNIDTFDHAYMQEIEARVRHEKSQKKLGMRTIIRKQE